MDLAFLRKMETEFNSHKGPIEGWYNKIIDNAESHFECAACQHNSMLVGLVVHGVIGAVYNLGLKPEDYQEEIDYLVKSSYHAAELNMVNQITELIDYSLDDFDVQDEVNLQDFKDNLQRRMIAFTEKVIGQEFADTRHLYTRALVRSLEENQKARAI